MKMFILLLICSPAIGGKQLEKSQQQPLEWALIPIGVIVWFFTLPITIPATIPFLIGCVVMEVTNGRPNQPENIQLLKDALDFGALFPILVPLRVIVLCLYPIFPMLELQAQLLVHMGVNRVLPFLGYEGYHEDM